MTNMDGTYVYYGHVLLKNYKLGHHLKLLDGEAQITFAGNDEFLLGEIIDITWKEQENFRYNRTKTVIQDSEILQKIMVEDGINRQKYKTHLAGEKARKEQLKLEDMTVKQLAKMAETSWEERLKIRIFLRDRI